jgi:hypothetical protein
MDSTAGTLFILTGIIVFVLNFALVCLLSGNKPKPEAGEELQIENEDSVLKES